MNTGVITQSVDALKTAAPPLGSTALANRVAALAELDPGAFVDLKKQEAQAFGVTASELERLVDAERRRQQPPPPVDGHGDGDRPDGNDPDQVLAELNSRYALIQVGNLVRILCEYTDPARDTHELAFLTANDFKLKYANRFVQVTRGNKNRVVNWATFWLSHPERRQYEGLTLIPGQAPPQFYNLWRGFTVEPIAGDCSRFKALMADVLCDGSETKFLFLWRWCAHLVQRPEELPEVAVVLRSGEGYGKGTFTDTLGYLFRKHYVPLTKMAELTGRFSGHLRNALLISANEAVWAGDKSGQGTLKAMITDPWITLETKGQDAITIRNYRRIIASSNENWVVPRGVDDRRFFCLDINKKQSREYFAAIRQELENGGYAALLYELLQEDLDGWHPRSHLPRTLDGEDMRYESSPSPHKFWHHCLLDGVNTPPDENRPQGAWSNEVKATALYNYYLDWCTRTRTPHPVSDEIFGIELRKVTCLQKFRPRKFQGVADPARGTCYRFPDHEEAIAQFAAVYALSFGSEDDC